MPWDGNHQLQKRPYKMQFVNPHAMIYWQIAFMYGTKTLGPRRLTDGLQEWNLEDGLLLFKGKIYVPNDPALH